MGEMGVWSTSVRTKDGCQEICRIFGSSCMLLPFLAVKKVRTIWIMMGGNGPGWTMSTVINFGDAEPFPIPLGAFEQHRFESILAYTPYDTYVRVLYIGVVTCST